MLDRLRAVHQVLMLKEPPIARIYKFRNITTLEGDFHAFSSWPVYIDTLLVDYVSDGQIGKHPLQKTKNVIWRGISCPNCKVLANAFPW